MKVNNVIYIRIPLCFESIMKVQITIFVQKFYDERK